MNNHVSARGYPMLPVPVAITLWIYARLLILHPSAFRHDFGQDIIQVFRQTCVDAYRRGGTTGIVRLWLPALADLLRGAAAERISFLRSVGSARMPPAVRYRRSASAVFASFVAFGIAGAGFAKMSEDVMKSSLPATYPTLAQAYDGVRIGAALAVVAVLAGGAPILLATVRYALQQRRRDILIRLAVPPLSLVIAAIYLSLIFRLDVGGHIPATIHTWQRILGVGSVAVVLLIGAAVSTAALLEAVRHSDLDTRLLRFSLIPGLLACLAMLGTVLADAVWNIGLWRDAPNLFFGNEGLLASSTLLTTTLQMSVMVIALLIATLALYQGLWPRRHVAELA